MGVSPSGIVDEPGKERDSCCCIGTGGCARGLDVLGTKEWAGALGGPVTVYLLLGVSTEVGPGGADEYFGPVARAVGGAGEYRAFAVGTAGAPIGAGEYLAGAAG